MEQVCYLLGLQQIDLTTWQGFESPNVNIPEKYRGVWFVLDMKGNAVVTIDLNLLSPNGKNSNLFYAIDTWRNYQSVLNSWNGIKLWFFAWLLQIRSDVDMNNDTVYWSIFRGLISLPFISPSKLSDKDPNVLHRTIIKRNSKKVVAKYKLVRVIDQFGHKTRYYQTMIDNIGPYVLLKPKKSRL